MKKPSNHQKTASVMTSKHNKGEKQNKTEKHNKADQPTVVHSLHYHIKKPSDVSQLPIIKGWDFSQPTLRGFLDSLATTGIQSTELAKAIDIGKMMVREKATIFLSFTSNMISSGVREQITYLTKHNLVHVLCTSAGGVEEDIIKARLPFRVGSFYPSGETLYDAGICRIGNIYSTTEHYAYLEQFLQPIFEELYQTQKKTGVVATPSTLISLLGKKLVADPQYDEQQSYVYWASMHNIPVFCPGIMDGSIGDMMYFFKQAHPDFVFDVSSDHKKIIDLVLSTDLTAGIILGGGISKHYILNANIFKEGFDYTVIISTADFSDASDSGGSPDEAVTWSKIKVRSPKAKVYLDASIAFPLFCYDVFVQK
jgi:deoxyhypusine synthase